MKNLAKQMNIPIFFIDTCYNPWDYVTETRVRYVRAQIDQLIKDLCEFTGKTWDDERFKEVMKISQRNSYLWSAPTIFLTASLPLSGFELFNYMSAMVCNRGKTSSTAILEQLNSEIEKHIEEGTSISLVEEQFRISWDGIACWPYLSHNLRTLKNTASTWLLPVTEKHGQSNMRTSTAWHGLTVSLPRTATMPAP